MAATFWFHFSLSKASTKMFIDAHGLKIMKGGFRMFFQKLGVGVHNILKKFMAGARNFCSIFVFRMFLQNIILWKILDSIIFGYYLIFITKFYTLLPSSPPLWIYEQVGKMRMENDRNNFRLCSAVHCHCSLDVFNQLLSYLHLLYYYSSNGTFALEKFCLGLLNVWNLQRSNIIQRTNS